MINDVLIQPESVDGFHKIGRAVVALVSQPGPTCSTGSSTQMNQFSAFEKTIIQRLRRITDEGSLSAMVEISDVIL